MLLQAVCIISKPSVYSNWSYSPETLNLGKNWRFFCPVWLWIQTDDPEKQQGTCSMLLRALCIISKPSVNSNWSYSLETLNSGQNWQFVSCVTLKFYGWFKKNNNRAPLLCRFKLYTSFHNHQWIQTVNLQSRNAQTGTKFVLTSDLDLWPFAWTSPLLMVITPENFMMIWLQEHCEKGVRQKGGRTNRQNHS